MKSAVNIWTDAFMSHFALHPSLCFMAGFLHFLAHICMRSNVQIACPECTVPQAWLAVFDWQTAPWAAPPGHCGSVPLDREKMQGKIKGRGTWPFENPVCTWGWRGTRLIAAPCREIGQRLAELGESACWLCSDAMALDGDTA